MFGYLQIHSRITLINQPRFEMAAIQDNHPQCSAVGVCWSVAYAGAEQQLVWLVRMNVVVGYACMQQLRIFLIEATRCLHLPRQVAGVLRGRPGGC